MVTLTNGAGGRVTDVSVAGGSCDPSTYISAGGLTMCTITMAPGCVGKSVGEAYSEDIEVSYLSPTGTPRTSSGTVRGPAD